MGRVREEKGRRKKIREERVSRKKIKVRKNRQVAQHCVFFQCFVAPEGRKVGSLKRLVQSRRCAAKLVARSAFGSQNCKSTTCWDHFFRRWTFKRCFVWQAQWILILHKRRGMFEEDLQRCMLRGRRRRSGR